MRKTYGNTWWGEQWLNALANIDFSNRLPRGKTYANKGLVSDILIKKNKITANVQGTEFLPYKVQINIPLFSKSQKNSILEIISSNPLYLSKLLNRNLPKEINNLCQQKNIHLFPDSWFDLKGSCSCPDSAIPCKHIAALLYIIANEIDKNPFLVFQLHDFHLFEELKNIGYTVQGQQEIPIILLEDLQQNFNTNKEINEWDEDIFKQLDFSRIPDTKENLLTILSKHPTFYPRGDFKKLLALAYSSVSKKTAKLKPTESNNFDFDIINQIEDIEILLDEFGSFLIATFRNTKGKEVLVFEKQQDLNRYLFNIPLAGFSNFSAPLKSLILVYQFAKKLILQSAYIPQLIQTPKEHFKIRWIPALVNPIVRSLSYGIKAILRSDLLFYRNQNIIKEPINNDKLIALLSLFLNTFVKETHGLDHKFAEHEIGHLFFNNEGLTFHDYESKEYPKAIQLWLNKFFLAEKKFVPVIKINEEKGAGFLLNISIQQRATPPVKAIKLHSVLKQRKYQTLKLEVLRDLAILSDYFPQINDLVINEGKEDLFFTPDEFVEVLFKILPTMELFGIKVMLPKALKKLFRPKLSLALQANEDSGTIKKKSIINLENMLDFHWQIALGDQMISEADFLKMVQKISGIVRINNQYVYLGEDDIKQLINQLSDPPKLDQNELLQIALTEDYHGAKISLDKEAQQVMRQLLESKEVAVPKGLQATLRPYQKSGYDWLYKNSRIGFGSLIADDMGLGKTLQVITTLLKLKEDGALGKEKALIIVPTTLLTNWVKEIQKFAPALKAFVYHGSNRKLDLLNEADILITTYGIARSETNTFSKKKWLVLAIDEAQAIKNPGTAQTKAIKKIKAAIIIAMSGTPVENRLSEYWSLFDFTNKGYLSSLAQFKKEFAQPIEAERDQIKLEEFRKITKPFILRRLKSDKSIIKDLPEKIEQDQFCQLTVDQTALYQKVVDATLKDVEKAEGIDRKAMILKLLTALKQICNHPRQFLKRGSSDYTLSGKTIMLFDLIRNIQELGEKTLIFTQYREMGELLVELLEKEFRLSIPFLHGGVSRKGRDEMVEDFQNNRATKILILSLKAGGTGLNLTKANNVIHYDLWWNPAVESQATDRAYRIGQQRNVMVHRFITQNTFEEKINELLQQKKELANLTVSTGETWIGDLSNEELREIVTM